MSDGLSFSFEASGLDFTSSPPEGAVESTGVAGGGASPSACGAGAGASASACGAGAEAEASTSGCGAGADTGPSVAILSVNYGIKVKGEIARRRKRRQRIIREYVCTYVNTKSAKRSK